MDIPLTLTAGAIWAYWLGVLIMVIRQHLSGRKAGVTPRQGPERFMWIIWVPTIAAWIALPAIALSESDSPIWGVPSWADGTIWSIVRWVAAIDAVACFAFTVVCWIKMGKSWAMANVPNADSELVTVGPFRWVRHPIYALSVVMMANTFLVLLTWPMLLFATLHITLMHLKASSEEKFLLEKYGQAYANYMKRTGRFLPKMQTPTGPDKPSNDSNG